MDAAAPDSDLGPGGLGSGRRDGRSRADWPAKLGLNGDGVTDGAEAPDGQSTADVQEEPTFDNPSKAEKNELYTEDQSFGSRPWWKANFFVSAPVLFGTWDGVFTSCMINIFGILIFLRTGWMVGNAGLGFSILIIFMTIGVALIAVLSAIGVCERCHMESGGVYFLLSHVLGARIGATIGILYCFGQAVACSLCVIGFGESIAALLHHDSIWIARGIAVFILIILLGINIAGVKWVIRLQLVLLVVLFVAVLDFAVGSFVHTAPEHGFVGYKVSIFVNNTMPEYDEGQSFFTVFGVFFPTATGVFAGINMSGDLRNPSKSIPVGTLLAVAVSTALYLMFALILGATCVRSALQENYMITEKVSVTGFLFLAGLYISSISSGMGGLYGSPRILQGIANDGVIPVIKTLSKGRGANKVPVLALLVISLIAIIFVFVGQVNTLGPVVTMPFMLTYGAVDYSNFVLAMSCRKVQLGGPLDGDFVDEAGADRLSPHLPSTLSSSNSEYGTVESSKCDRASDAVSHRGSWGEKTGVKPQNEKLLDKSTVTEITSLASEIDDSTSLLGSDSRSKHSKTQIFKQPKSFYFLFCNPWLSLFGALATLASMFAIQWVYALVNILIAAIVYTYIGFSNPGVFPGIAEFSLIKCIIQGMKRLCCRYGQIAPEQVVVTPGVPSIQTTSSQLTEENEDFASRERYHQSEVMKGKNFDDFESE